MVRKRSSITLSVEAHEKAQLEQLALELGQTWGDNPNISKLIKSIAKGKLRVAVNHDWTRGRIDTLSRVLDRLKDESWHDEALEVASLLLERSEISQPLRHDIQTWVNRPKPAWRLDIERFLRQHRPFRLDYQDAADRILSYTVRHGAIAPIEDRQYLCCWCDETEGNQDIEALRHNWTLRLDRIPQEAVITPVGGQWRPELSHVDVEFHLLNRLAVGYRSKSEADLSSDWLPEQQVRRVVRKITSTFWFFRQVRRYGQDCVLVGPAEVRKKFVEELTQMVSHYQSIRQ